MNGVGLSRQEIVTIVMALEEFRDEYGPGERDLAARVNEILGGATGDEFALIAGPTAEEEA